MEAGHPGTARPRSGHANHNQIGNQGKLGFTTTYTDAYPPMLLLKSCEVEQYVPKVVVLILHFPAMRSAGIPVRSVIASAQVANGTGTDPVCCDLSEGGPSIGASPICFSCRLKLKWICRASMGILRFVGRWQQTQQSRCVLENERCQANQIGDTTKSAVTEFGSLSPSIRGRTLAPGLNAQPLSQNRDKVQAQ
jgi:hypothetical protein